MPSSTMDICMGIPVDTSEAGAAVEMDIGVPPPPSASFFWRVPESPGGSPSLRRRSLAERRGCKAPLAFSLERVARRASASNAEDTRTDHITEAQRDMLFSSATGYLRSGSVSSEDVGAALLSGSTFESSSPSSVDTPVTATTADTPDTWAAVEFESFMCSISRAQMKRAASPSSPASAKRRDRSDTASGSWSPPSDSERDTNPAFAVRVCLAGPGKRIRIE